MAERCHGRVSACIFILSYLRTRDPERILPYVDKVRHTVVVTVTLIEIHFKKINWDGFQGNVMPLSMFDISYGVFSDWYT